MSPAPPSSTVLHAEWAPQTGVLLIWSHPWGDWQHWFEAAEENFAALAVAVADWLRRSARTAEDGAADNALFYGRG